MTHLHGERPRPPAAIQRSLFCWWFAIGAQILSDVVQVIVPGSANSLSQLSLHPGQVTATGVSVPGIVFQAVSLLIWAALVHNVGLGSNGARWVLTVLAAIEELVLLGVIIISFVFPSVGSILVGVVGLAVFVLVLLAIIAMHRAEARIHFQQLT